MRECEDVWRAVSGRVRRDEIVSTFISIYLGAPYTPLMFLPLTDLSFSLLGYCFVYTVFALEEEKNEKKVAWIGFL